MKRIEDLELISKRQLSEKTYILTLHSRQGLPIIEPGQFVNIRVDNSKTTYLRRPISVHDCRLQDQELDLWVDIVGAGTEGLSRTRIGDTLNLVYPLGRGFSLPQVKSKVLLIGGGCGVAPLLYLARCLSNANHNITILIGARSKSDIVCLDRYAQFATVLPITEDGSLGEKGLVTTHSILQNTSFDQIYCCGPTPMMQAVAKIAQNKGTACQVSLENTMACGVGACLCCVTASTKGHVCVCTEGPVFNIGDLPSMICHHE